jgi:hypothetical protein
MKYKLYSVHMSNYDSHTVLPTAYIQENSYFWTFSVQDLFCQKQRIPYCVLNFVIDIYYSGTLQNICYIGELRKVLISLAT